MSQTKKYKFYFILILMLVSFFMFGCKNEIPVEDIYFNLSEGEQVVLMVGQSLDVNEFVVVRPSYATNRQYTITSYNQGTVKVEGNRLSAIKEGSAAIKITSNDNPLKEAMMTVIVKSQQEQLAAPLNLTYDKVTQSFNFDPVSYASSYTLKINGEEIDLGNSVTFNLAQYSKEKFDRVLVAQVKANAPSYSYALKSSTYSSEYKIYQAGTIENLRIVGGVVRFDKYSDDNIHNFYFDDNLFADKVSEDAFSIKTLPERYAGATIDISIETVVSNEIKAQYGDEIHYFNSARKNIVANILDAVNVSISSTNLTWQNVAHTNSYSIWIDGAKQIETSDNHFDLRNLANYNTLITSVAEHEIKVLPNLDPNSIGVGQTTKQEVIKAKKLYETVISCSETGLAWSNVENVSAYSIKLTGENVDLATSTMMTSLDMKNYGAGNYSVQIVSMPNNSEGSTVYYLPSNVATKEFSKQEAVSAFIENYVLKISNLDNNTARLNFDVDALDKNLTGVNGEIATVDLSQYVFEAGKHSITITKIGDANTLASDEFVVEFVQLEKIDTVSISNSVASVVRSDINEDASIKLVTRGNGIDPIIIENTGYEYNTENTDEDYWLSAGKYTTQVYVYGDGSKTFSYRENNVVVPCAETSFEVLSATTGKVLDPAVSKLTVDEIQNASGYDIYKTINDKLTFDREITVNEYNFVLTSGGVVISIQTIGDGSRYLNSVLSAPIVVTRLQTPNLQFNNTNNVLSKTDLNDAAVVAGYKLIHNGNQVDYDFKSSFALADASVGNEFALTALAIAGGNNSYYLNSLSFNLELDEISNVATISLNGLSNNLVIKPTGHTQQFDLVVVFDFAGQTETLATTLDAETNKKVLSNGKTGDDKISLTYSYGSKRYTIKLIDENHNAIIEKLNNEFSVKVRFIKPSTGDDKLINSQFTDAVTLNLNRIASDTEISVNEQNQIVLSASKHTQEYAIVVVINNGTDMVFASNGEGKLVCDLIELNYTYSNKTYYIDMFDDELRPLISNLNSNFDVKVKYSFAYNGTQTDLDSDYSSSKSVQVQKLTTITRDGQNLKFANIKETYTYLNYYLLVNNYPIQLDETAVSAEGFIKFNIEYVYSKTPKAHLKDINKIEVVVNNIDTSVENPILSRKSEAIYVQKTDTVELSSYKFNNNENGKNNNSAFVAFNTYKTSYNKEYIVRITHSKQVIFEKHYIDNDALESLIELGMDSIAATKEISGDLNVNVEVWTSGNYTYEGNIIEVFNSGSSNVETLNKIANPQDLSVSNSTLSFGAVENAVGYEIYEKTGVGYVKLNSVLVTSNSYEIENMTGEKIFVVKAVSRSGGYSNSSYSEPVTINKIANPTISVENGKIKIKFADELIELLQNEALKITPEITNGSSQKIEIDLKNLSSKELTLDGSTLTAEPYALLSYNKASLTAEKLSLKVKVVQTAAVDGVYFLNSDVVEVDCYGLFAPTNIKKTTNENNAVELISWTANDKNVLNGNTLSVGYIFKIEYMDGENEYYSNDVDLKYYDEATKTYVSYPSVITGTSAIFPAGYGVDADGELKVKFGAGTYKICVQSVPLTAMVGYNLCGSLFSETCEFDIMSTVTLNVDQGKVVWNTIAKADYYLVSVYEQGENEALLVDTIYTNEYDFTNQNLNALTGVYKLVVKAVSTKEDTLNGAESEALYVYRLPEANSVSIDDGNLIFTATKFFEFADVELVDVDAKASYKISVDNTELAQTQLAGLKITEWKNFNNEAAINTTRKYSVNLDNEVLKVLDGRDYSINITLLGNTSEKLGLINSSKSVSLSNLTASKLKPNVTEVSLGVVSFTPDDNYATISKDGEYKSLISLNYSFNGTLANDFWKNTVIYKINVTSPNGPISIYAVDYYSVTTAISSGLLTTSDYDLMNGVYGLYACLKYNYTDNSQTKILYFNVYQDNQFNLRDYESLYYYQITEKITEGVSKFECASKHTTVDLSLGGSFAVSIYMLGGDSFVSGDKTIGYLSAQSNIIKTFVRYGINPLSTYNGQVQFNNLIPVIDGAAIDHPIYKVMVQSLDGEQKETIYIYHTTEEDAKNIAKRHDPENYASALYVQTKINEVNDAILFDMSEYFDAGTYIVSIRTLAGLGTNEGDEQDYLLNAQNPKVEYTFQKLSDTDVTSSNGVLEFAQSYIVRDSQSIYNEEYEITLYDVATKQIHVYSINSKSAGVTIDNATHKVQYVIPAKLTIDKKNVVVDGGKQFKIKVRAIAQDNYILNGTYKNDGDNDVEYTFEKSLGLSESSANKLRIENGILKWKVLDLDNYINTVINISFLDENSQTKNIVFEVGDMNRYEINGEYQYHYYVFTDNKYDLSTTGGVYIKDKINYNLEGGGTEARDVIYTITAYTTGVILADKNIINSNYSSAVETTRLSTVDAAGIKTMDGVLVWNSIEKASAYEVTLKGNKNYTFTTTEESINFLKEEYQIEEGVYSILIKAIGNSNISSMMSDVDGATEFTQLSKVDISSIKIEGKNIVWAAVEKADKYNIEFSYTDIDGNQQKDVKVVEENQYEAPTGIRGLFTIKISAISVGAGKEFNGKAVEFTSSNETPMQVEKFEFDVENNRFVIDVRKENFLSGDQLLIIYNYAEYDAQGEKSPVLINEFITYQQGGRFEQIDENVERYYYPITIMGVYDNISVQVIRPNTLPSNAVQSEGVDFNLFAYGAGTAENPYRLSSDVHLMNIGRFASANYELTSSIYLTAETVKERLNNGAIVCEEFKGVLDGANYAILGFKSNDVVTYSLDLQDVENMALFTKLDNATIKNLTIGSEKNQLILSNMFANNVKNMINLSLIASGAQNSIINNVKILNVKIQVTANGTISHEQILIAGMVNNLSTSIVTNSIVDLKVNIAAQLSSNVKNTYVAGVASIVNNSNIGDTTNASTSGAEISLAIESNLTNVLNYVGGAVAYYEGNTSKSTGITKTNANITISNVKSIYLGGLIGFARYVNINNCTTQGTYTQSGINYQTYIGGLVGFAQSSTINSSGSSIVFNVAVSSIDDKYIGAIAGGLAVLQGVSCEVSNCCMSTTYQEKTTIAIVNSNSQIALGIYGYKDVAVSVTGCYQKEN